MYLVVITHKEIKVRESSASINDKIIEYSYSLKKTNCKCEAGKSRSLPVHLVYRKLAGSISQGAKYK